MPRQLNVAIEDWPYGRPLTIAGRIFTGSTVVVATVADGEHTGRGESLGVFYRQDSAAKLVAEIETVRYHIESGLGRARLRGLLPPGGARNALDCALWDLEAKQAGIPAWRLAGLREPQPTRTTFTIGADSPTAMADTAFQRYANAKAIKLKLLGDSVDANRILKVREARPDVWLGVDANQSLTEATLRELIPILRIARVALIEQPCRAGEESQMLEGLELDIPLAADESVQSLSELDEAIRYYDLINIKLDKCGGLTEAFMMAERARRYGLGVMIGNMGGTSLSIAPALLLAPYCEIVDLDGPIFLAKDRSPSVSYIDGFVEAPEALWGYP